MKRLAERIKNTNKILLVALSIALLSTLILIYIQPIIAQFYGLTFAYQALYAVCLFGFPILLFLPSLLVSLPFSLFKSNEHGFVKSWFRVNHLVFLIISSFTYVFISIMGLSKLCGNDPFVLNEYDQIKGYEGDTSDLRTGDFCTFYSKIIRTETTQIEKFNKNDSMYYSIEWLSNNEYKLINSGESNGTSQTRMYKNDTSFYKIVSNEPDRYICYAKFGKYTDSISVFKGFSQFSD